MFLTCKVMYEAKLDIFSKLGFQVICVNQDVKRILTYAQQKQNHTRNSLVTFTVQILQSILPFMIITMVS